MLSHMGHQYFTWMIERNPNKPAPPSLRSPHNTKLPVLFFLEAGHSFLYNLPCDPTLPVKAIPADWKNAVVRLQHVVAGADHDGFCQIFSNKAIYLIADAQYLFFVHRNSPFNFSKKLPTILLDGW